MAHLGKRGYKINLLGTGQEQRSIRLATATGMAICVYGMQATMLGTLLPGFSKILTPAQSGTVAAVQSVALICGSLATGPVLDRVGAKPGIVCGLILIATAMIMLPQAHAYGPILLTMAGLGLGGGVISTGTNTMASMIGGTNKAPMLNLLNVFFGLGALATPALGAAFAPEVLCLFIALLGLTVLTFLAVTPVPPRLRPYKGPARPRGALMRPLFFLHCLFLLFYVAAEVGIWNWLATYLTGKGTPRSTALRVLSFGFAAGLVMGRLTASRFLGRFRQDRVTLVCSVLMVFFTSAVLITNNPLVASVAVFCCGFVMAPVYPTTLGLIGDAFPSGTASAIGIAVTMGWIGVAASSWLIGSIAERARNGLATGLLVIPAVSALMIVVNLMFLRISDRRESKEATG